MTPAGLLSLAFPLPPSSKVHLWRTFFSATSRGTNKAGGEKKHGLFLTPARRNAESNGRNKWASGRGGLKMRSAAGSKYKANGWTVTGRVTRGGAHSFREKISAGTPPTSGLDTHREPSAAARTPQKGDPEVGRRGISAVPGFLIDARYRCG